MPPSNLVRDLRKAERVFRKQGRHNYADYTKLTRGALFDHRNPDLRPARHLIEEAYA